MIFGRLNREKIWYENLTDLSTSPVRCSHFTLGNPKKVIFNSIIHTYFWLFTLSQKKTNCNPPENVTTLTCELQNFFVWLKVCCVLSNVRSSEKSPVAGCRRRLWKEPIVICGNWNVRQAMSRKCSEWPPFALIDASSFFRHWSVA